MVSSESGATARVYYATDTYCIWCWGFGPSLRAFAERHVDDVLIDVVPGGLLVGERVVPVGQKREGVLSSAQRVEELCGVPTGAGFRAAVEEGSTVLDSSVAARLFVGLRAQVGIERGLEVAHALQTAWYHDGLDLHDVSVVRRLAAQLGADAEQLLAYIATDAAQVEAECEFQRRRDLGIKGYPSLLLETPDGLRQVGGPTSSLERLEHCYERLLAGMEPDHDPEEDEE